MILEKLEKPEVTAIQSNIDDRFNSAALPTSHLNSSRWILCTVGEDVHRFALVEAAKIWPQENSRAVRGRFIRMLDRYKYSLRHALDLCESKLPATSLRDVRLTSAESYTTALELLIKTASEYAEATRLFSSYHAGNTELWIDRGTGTIHTKLDERTAQYSALELLIGSDKHEFSPLIHLVSLFSGPVFYSPEMQSVIEWGSTVHKIIERVALKRGRLKYQIITQFAKDLFSEFNVVSSFLPQNWQFPWGSAELAQSFFAALQAICTYHLLSVHFGGLRYGLEGVGVDQICLNMKAERLSEEISRIAGLPKEVSARMIACLTLGVDTNTPDPALQPLVPIGEEELAIPGIFVLSSNWARNMLSLHARL